MSDRETQLARAHFEMIHGLIEERACPSRAELCERMNVAPSEMSALLEDLAAIHGVVLHPHVVEPWIVHPFSLTPTLHWIQAERGGWWAPCVWCAFGVATLVGGEVTLHTRYGGEGEPLTVPIRDGQPSAFADVAVHFAIPPARAWDNVHEHCAMVLPFRSADEIAAWSARHHLPLGEAVPLSQVAALARDWYGAHASPDWHKWTVAEAQEIFQRAGLVSEFWDLGARAGRF
ncbi:MAG: organomercurial lyase [Bryobacteraceae bacterium]|jgi:hypothetical protein